MRKLHVFYMNDSKRKSLRKKNRQLKVAQPMNPNLNYLSLTIQLFPNQNRTTD